MDVDLDPYENDIYQSDVELEHVDDQTNTIEKYKKDKLEETLRGKICWYWNLKSQGCVIES